MVEEPEEESRCISADTLQHTLLLQLKIWQQDFLQCLKRVHLLPLSVPVSTQPFVLYIKDCVEFNLRSKYIHLSGGYIHYSLSNHSGLIEIPRYTSNNRTVDLGSCLFCPGVRLHQYQGSSWYQEISGLFQQLGWVRDTTESVAGDDAAERTGGEGREVAPITNSELHLAAILLGRNQKYYEKKNID